MRQTDWPVFGVQYTERFHAAPILFHFFCWYRSIFVTFHFDTSYTRFIPSEKIVTWTTYDPFKHTMQIFPRLTDVGM